MLGVFYIKEIAYMGKYSVPEHILKCKPKGTMVKAINDHYYVYEFKTIKGEDGKRHTKMGREIGKIEEGIGFVPNNNRLPEDEITTLEYGQYAVVVENSQNILSLLKEFFNPADATQIYVASLIHFVEGFTYMKALNDYYSMSYLSLKYPTLKLGYDALATLYDSLGRRQSDILAFEAKLIEQCSSEIAIDGHVIGSCSGENDLAGEDYKCGKLGEPQINLMMAYDVNTGIPLISRMYAGNIPDKISVQDFLKETEMQNLLFIVDRGFYSEENIKLFSSKGNSYIIPLASNLSACKKAIQDLNFKNQFVYQKGEKQTVIEYKDEMISGRRVLTFRDLSEATAKKAKYLKCIEQGKKNYTEEGFNQYKDLWGVYVLQTSLKNEKNEYPAQKIFELYKKRWTIETFYNYLKNTEELCTLYQQDYYKAQGVSFIMLVAALIHSEFEKAVKKVHGKNVTDCLCEARMIKINKRQGTWSVANCGAKGKAFLEQLNTSVKIELP